MTGTSACRPRAAVLNETCGTKPTFVVSGYRSTKDECGQFSFADSPNEIQTVSVGKHSVGRDPTTENIRRKEKRRIFKTSETVCAVERGRR